LSPQAIYGEEFCLLSRTPPTFTVRLREPGCHLGGGGGDNNSSSGAGDSSGATSSGLGPPSRLFALRVQLPQVRPLLLLLLHI
jgi:hypothetical protein